MIPPTPRSTLFPYTTLFRSRRRVPGRQPPPAASAGTVARRPGQPVRGRRRQPDDLLVHGSNPRPSARLPHPPRSEEHTSELQSQSNLVCRLLLEKKKIGSRS